MQKHKLSKLNEWAKDKPYLLVTFAEKLAEGTEACFKVLKSVKAGERIEVLSGPVRGSHLHMSLFS
jgi:hypothetical protein